MADIQTYLDYILSKVYGKDVRQAIVDSIRQCYEDTSEGIVPVLSTEEIAGGTRVTITAGAYSTHFDVMNGISPQINIASQASDMTDTDLIYVYTKDPAEDGFITGYWYFYDDYIQNWRWGGEYQSSVPAIDSTLTVTGAAADAKKTGDEITDLKSAIEQGGGGMTVEFKQALETLLTNVVYRSNDPTGRTYLTALHNAMYPPANLTSISAVYTQSGTVYDTDTLDSLKADLVVTAHYNNSTTEVVTSYTLSGTLTEGTSTITVSYGGKTTTFNVTVSTLSYITNGLIHRWDGIDNTASGHDSSVTVWEDLVGSNDLTMNSSTYATWTGNALSLAGNGAQYLDCVGGEIGTGEATVEVVISPQSSATAQLIVFFGTNQRSACYYSDKTFSMNGASSQTYPIGVSEFSEVHHLAAAYNSGVATGTYYLNGEEATQGSTTHSLSGNQTGLMRVGTTGSNVPGYPYTGLIHSIRIYDRLLSASEIAQNYAVDVARFGFGE